MYYLTYLRKLALLLAFKTLKCMFLISSSFNLPVHLSCVLICVYFPVPRKHTLTVEEERVILFNTYKKKEEGKCILGICSEYIYFLIHQQKRQKL